MIAKPLVRLLDQFAVRPTLVFSYFVPTHQDYRLAFGVKCKDKSPKTVEPETKLLDVGEGGIVQRVNIWPPQVWTELFRNLRRDKSSS